MKKRANTNNQGGFTLIELLVTLSIVSILTSVAVAGYDEYRYRAYLAEVYAAERAGITDLVALHMDQDFYVEDNYHVRRLTWPDGTTENTGPFEFVLPAARVSEGAYLSVRIGHCRTSANPEGDFWFINTNHYLAKKRSYYGVTCDGGTSHTLIDKETQSWW